jgi:hypothetical protein
MKTRNVLAISTLALAGMFSGAAIAIPSLQLDIVNGSYNAGPEDTEISSQNYVVRALQNYAEFNDATFYLSIALTDLDGDSISASGSYGSISINGTDYNATGNMTYGAPPVEIYSGSAADGDLAGHGIFPTWFLELSFGFDIDQTIEAYNVEDVTTAKPEPCATSSCGTMYYMDFVINTTGLSEEFGLHYDLYLLEEDSAHEGNLKVVDNAPFSHDASGYPGDGGDGTDGGDSCNPEDPFDPCEVPEPTTLWLFALALLVTSLYRAAPRATSRKF